jgi:predicted outer membrane repeat protein
MNRRTAMRLLVTTSAVIFLSFSVPSATTIHVDRDGGGDYLTIQEGVDAASEGDTVLVAPGTYTGVLNRNIEFEGTNIVLMSEMGAASTIINPENLTAAFDLHNGEDRSSVIDGFTIMNSYIGINIGYASATVRNCILRDNSNNSNGAGMWISYADPQPVITDCVFHDNVTLGRGAAIFCDRSWPTITGCTFYRNTVTSTETHTTYGGGALNFHMNSSPAVISNCTFIGNSSPVGGGSIHVRYGDLELTRSVIAFSEAGNGVELWGTGSVVNHCVIFGNAGGDTLIGYPDNLYQDPLLCNIGDDNLTLCANSTCLAGNNSWGELIGAHGQGCGECDAPIEAVAWGHLKFLFR